MLIAGNMMCFSGGLRVRVERAAEYGDSSRRLCKKVPPFQRHRLRAGSEYDFGVQNRCKRDADCDPLGTGIGISHHNRVRADQLQP